jgi:hypothetical protein
VLCEILEAESESKASLHCSTPLVPADLYHDRFHIVIGIYALLSL